MSNIGDRGLGNRREHESFDMVFGPIVMSVGVGRFEGGGLAEVFFSAGKAGSQVDAMARETAILASLLLQQGVGAQRIAEALPVDDEGRPMGPLGRVLEFLGSDLRVAE
ncbi:MAG: hypothetical protein P4L82_12020 [Ancalomicrobiaceae bacterium]|nr:hypothetical protein [Ancalomicrobiaceae bacterium]